MGINVESVEAVFVPAPGDLLDGLFTRNLEFLLKVKKGEGVVGNDTGSFDEGLKD